MSFVGSAPWSSLILILPDLFSLREAEHSLATVVRSTSSPIGGCKLSLNAMLPGNTISINVMSGWISVGWRAIRSQDHGFGPIKRRVQSSFPSVGVECLRSCPIWDGTFFWCRLGNAE